MPADGTLKILGCRSLMAGVVSFSPGAAWPFCRVEIGKIPLLCVAGAGEMVRTDGDAADAVLADDLVNGAG